LILLLDFAATREQQVALRTQFNKILSFVKVLALLNQKNRVRFQIEDNKQYVIANTEDYVTAMQILEPTILETISRIEKRQQEVLDLFENLGVLDKNKVAEKLKVSVRTAARALKTLAATGYLRENMTCKPYTYELLREKPNSLDIKQNASEYELFYQKELKSFLNSIVTPCQNEIPPFFF
jgi:predicted transcriptional regulator